MPDAREADLAAGPAEAFESASTTESVEATEATEATESVERPTTAAVAVPPVVVDVDAAVIELAKAALLEVTPTETVGEFSVAYAGPEGLVSVLFSSAMAGYPYWNWTVSVSLIDTDAPSVVEIDLMPGDGALVAPEWVPWSDRLVEHQAGQELTADESAADDALDADDGAEGIDDDDDEDDELVESDVLIDEVDDIDGVDFEDQDTDGDEPVELDDLDDELEDGSGRLGEDQLDDDRPTRGD